MQPSADAVLARVHPDDDSLVRHAFEAFSTGVPAIDVSHRLLMPDGAIKYVRAVARLRDAGTDEAEYVGAVCDLTRSRHAQEALLQAQADLAHVTRVATLGELTATIAHEVNQPLAGIVTNGEACIRWLDRCPPEMNEVRSAILRMIGDGRRASQVIQRVRSLARKDVPQSMKLAVNDIISDTLPLVDRELERHRIAIRFDLAPNLPLIAGDAVQLQQVLINLLINSIQSIASVSDRPGELMIRTRLASDEMVEVALQDSGAGIAPDIACRLFAPFFTTKRDGIGMGLAICRSIIEAHGGRIWVAHSDMPGALLLFVLPVPSRNKP